MPVLADDPGGSPERRRGAAAGAEGTVTQGKRAQRVADTRLRLIEVSLDLYSRQGFSTTTIDQIVEAAGIHRSTFFRYFDGKEAVLFAPITGSHDWFVEQLRARPAGEPLVRSVATVCTEGTWPLIDRQHLSKIRRVIKGDPMLQVALGTPMSSTFAPRLVECLQSMDPQADRRVIEVVAALAAMWSDRAISTLIESGGSLRDHFAEVIRATAQVAPEILRLAEELT
jgi:AcrR family transcriptional regulator